MASLVGKTLLNRYHVQEFLGRGGMAEVYKVWDNQRMTFLAMKVLLDDLALDLIFFRRFTREANTLEKLQHPNIVRFFGFEKDNRHSFILMEYVEGETLKHLLHDTGGKPISHGKIQEVMRPVCGALQYAHNQGFIHTDIKPANIMFNKYGEVKLTDFGMARIADTATTTMVGAGTPAYMAPEQIRGEGPSPQSDIYSLGIVLYEMFTGGERPFTGEKAVEFTGSTSEKVRWEHMNLPAPSPKQWNPLLSDEIVAVILKCLEKEPANRYQTSLELFNALKQAMGDVREDTPTIKKQQRKEVSPSWNSFQTDPGKRTDTGKRSKLFSSRIILPIVLIAIALFFLRQQSYSFANIVSSIGSTISKNTSILVYTTGILILAFVIFMLVRHRKQLGLVKESKQKNENGNLQEDIAKGLETEYLVSAVKPNNENSAIRLIGRKQELRIKDIIVHFGGGRYLIRGYGRFGSTALIKKIIVLAKEELQEKHAQKSALISIRLELPQLLNSKDTVLALVRELRVEAIRQKFPKQLKKKLKKLDPKSKQETIKSSNSQSISFKAAPVPNIEASLSRKTDKEPRQIYNSLTRNTLSEIISDFLEPNGTKHAGKLDTFLDRVFKVKNMATRVVIILEKITSPDVFKTLHELRLFDNKNITILAFVSQEIYLKWDIETRNLISLLGFRDHYVPSLWEDKTKFIETMMLESLIKSNSISSESDFKDHVAYMTRGAPGDILSALINPKYAEFNSGNPTINLIEIEDWEFLEHNAIKQRLLDASWDKILKNHFVGREERDQARMGIYELMDWIDKAGGFSHKEIQSFASEADIKIAQSDYRIHKTLDHFLDILVEADYLGKKGDSFSLKRYDETNLKYDEYSKI